MPASGRLFFVFFSIYYSRDCLRKKYTKFESKLWSERFLIYSRLRQMNIESLFVLSANISSISISTEKLCERTALISPLNLAIFPTRSFLRLSFFLLAITRCTLTCSVSFETLNQPHVDFDSGARENIFGGPLESFGYSRKAAAANIEPQQISASIKLEFKIRSGEKKFRFQVARASGMEKIMWIREKGKPRRINRNCALC